MAPLQQISAELLRQRHASRLAALAVEDSDERRSEIFAARAEAL
jgi:hypothetical protein